MLDIVEIALDRFTDYMAFERLACEVLRDECYPLIKPLGGQNDGGIDAEEMSLFVAEGKRQRSIFQMSMEEGALGKIRKTLKRLLERNEKFDSLVYVTIRTVSTSKQDDLKKKIRSEYDIPIEIIAREKIINKLADYSNGIFHRHFPNIETQLDELRKAHNSEITHNNEGILLKAAITLYFCDKSSSVYNLTFDHLVLAILIDSYPVGLSKQDIIERLTNISCYLDFTDEDLLNCLNKPSFENSITNAGDKYYAHVNILDQNKSSEIRSELALESLVGDILEYYYDICGKDISSIHKGILHNNCRDVLVEYFRLFGRELINLTKDRDAPQQVFIDLIPELVTKAKRRLSDELGELLITCIAEVFQKPSHDQANLIMRLSFSYIGAAILGLDPVLRELSGDKLSKKSFFLDTDIILTCIVKETPLSSTYTSIINRLLNTGANILISDSCIQECADHAYYSYKTYDYFGDTLLSLSESTVQEQVWNAFVKGYYYGRKIGSIPENMSYKKYIKNYLDRRDPKSFMKEVISNHLSDKVILKNVEELIGSEEIPDEIRNNLEREIYEQLCNHAKKSEYRTDEQNWNLAKTDAQLFLSVYYLNAKHESLKNKILPGRYYLISSSGRYHYCARKIDLHSKVTTRLQVLAGVLKTLGKISMTPTEFMQLIENPFLINAVDRLREDISALIDAGINLQGVSLPRLRRDYDNGMHVKITSLKECCETQINQNDPRTLGDEQYLNLIEDAKERGYQISPNSQKLIDRLEIAKRDYEKRLEIIDEYADKVNTFGRRKQKHLKRIEAMAKKKK